MPPKNGIAADAPQSRAGSSDDEVQHQGVAGLGALDVERAGLRVDEAQVDLLARQVVDAAQDTAERVVGPEPQRRAGLDRMAGDAPPKVYAYCSRVGRVLDDVHPSEITSGDAQP